MLIQLEDINKTYDNGQPLHVLKGVNLSIEEGEFVSIMGASGSGKSTLLKILIGLADADAGSVRLGTKVHIGYYDQEHQILHPDKTLFEELQDTYPSLNNTQIRDTLAAFLFTGDERNDVAFHFGPFFKVFTGT